MKSKHSLYATFVLALGSYRNIWKALSPVEDSANDPVMRTWKNLDVRLCAEFQSTFGLVTPLIVMTSHEHMRDFSTVPFRVAQATQFLPIVDLAAPDAVHHECGEFKCIHMRYRQIIDALAVKHKTVSAYMNSDVYEFLSPIEEVDITKVFEGYSAKVKLQTTQTGDAEFRAIADHISASVLNTSSASYDIQLRVARNDIRIVTSRESGLHVTYDLDKREVRARVTSEPNESALILKSRDNEDPCLQSALRDILNFLITYYDEVYLMDSDGWVHRKFEGHKFLR